MADDPCAGGRRRVLLLTAMASARAASAQVADWPSERPPRPLAARDVKFPPYALKTLPNGLQVIAVSHHEQPAVSLRLMVRAGGAQDPADKPGVAALVAALLDQGTTTRSAEQIAHTIDSIGGVIGAGSGTEYTFVAGDRDEGQLRPRAGSGVRHREEPGVRAAGNRAAAQADAVVADRQLRRPRVSGRRGVRAARVWAASLRPARLRHAGVARRHHPRRSGHVPQDLVRGQQRHPRRRRRRDDRRGVRRRRARVRQLGQGRERGGAGRGAAARRRGGW